MAKCLRCGRKVGNATQYCKPCRAEMKKEVPVRKQRFTATDSMRIKNVQCRTCKYSWRMPMNVDNYLCDYLEKTGHMRPCEPSPNCTVYERKWCDIFKKLRGCSLTYNQQLLIRAICLNYPIMPEEVKAKINRLCDECGGEYRKALFRVLTTYKSVRFIAIDENVSESQLYRFRLSFYEKFY